MLRRAVRLAHLPPFPDREIFLFGQPAGLAQPVEKFVLEGLTVQFGLRQAPQLRIGVAEGP